jgi:PmbA protein
MSNEDLLAQQRTWALELAQTLVEAAKAAGADVADATVGAGSSLSAKARDGEIEHVSRSSSRAAGVRAIVDGKLGFATAAAAPSSKAEAEELARSAVALARISTPSEHNVLPEATALAGDDLEAHINRLKLWDGDVAGADAGWATRHALEMEAILSAADGVSTVREVGASTRRSVFALASANGFSGAYGGTSAQLHASGVADDGEKKQVDGWWSAARHFPGLLSAEEVAAEAARRCVARVGARKVPSGRMPVIFDPSMARTFIGAVLGAINGESVSREASFLMGLKGEAVFTPGYALRDDPGLVRGLGSRPFDGEGLACKPCTIIDDDGVLKTWLLDARSAHRLGEPPTGHAARGSAGLPGPSSSNIVLDGGQGDLASIIKETKRGLLVTQLLGHSPDMITGEYSRGASGFLIVDGEIVHPVEEITVAGDMKDMMKGLDRVGADLDTRSSWHIPTLRFAELMVSGS